MRGAPILRAVLSPNLLQQVGGKVCTLCTIQNVEGKMGNSMKPAGAKACAFRGRIATFIEEKETEKASWFSVAVSWLRRRLFGWGSINFSSY